MAKKIFIGGRIESAEVGGVVTGANAILDDTKQKKQNVINKETDDELARLENAKQNNLTFDNAPIENSTNPVTSGGVYTADKALSDAIEAILLLIPSAATALNKLVDIATMNSSISTATATFRGTYNVVTDLGLTVDATYEQIAAKLAEVITTADNNDYAFVQVPVSAESTDIRRTERYKFNGTVWAYEYDLNTSGFTAAQWAAINSGITLALVTKLTELPTAAALQLALNAKQDTLTFDTEPTALSQNPVTSGGVYTAIQAVATALSNYSTATDGRLNVLEGLIPTEATSDNQLADKAYVLAQILAATPAFKGQFVTLAELQAVASPKAGDLGIVRTKDSDGHDVFTFYQYMSSAWNVFYSLSYYPQVKPATTGTTGDYPYNGMGRVKLAKNIVNGVNTLTQDMFYKGAVGSRVPNTNTIFVIQYDYVLGEDITVPANCVLEFDGGSLSNGAIEGNNTIITYNSPFVGTNLTITGCKTDRDLLVDTDIFKSVSHIQKEIETIIGLSRTGVKSVFSKGTFNDIDTINITNDIDLDFSGSTINLRVVDTYYGQDGFVMPYSEMGTDTGVHNVSFRNMNIFGSSTQASSSGQNNEYGNPYDYDYKHVFRLFNVDNVVFENVHVSNFIKGVKDVYPIDPAIRGDLWRRNMCSIMFYESVIVDRCSMNYSCSEGWLFVPKVSKTNYATITNCTASYNYYTPFTLVDGRCLFENNKIDHGACSFVHLDGYEMLIRNNEFTDMRDTGSVHGYLNMSENGTYANKDVEVCFNKIEGGAGTCNGIFFAGKNINIHDNYYNSSSVFIRAYAPNQSGEHGNTPGTISDNDNITIENNIVLSGGGLILSPYVKNCRMYNNHVTCTITGDTMPSYAAVLFGNSYNTTLIGNTFIDGGYTGFSSDYTGFVRFCDATAVDNVDLGEIVCENNTFQRTKSWYANGIAALVIPISANKTKRIFKLTFVNNRSNIYGTKLMNGGFIPVANVIYFQNNENIVPTSIYTSEGLRSGDIQELVVDNKLADGTYVYAGQKASITDNSQLIPIVVTQEGNVAELRKKNTIYYPRLLKYGDGSLCMVTVDGRTVNEDFDASAYAVGDTFTDGTVTLKKISATAADFKVEKGFVSNSTNISDQYLQDGVFAFDSGVLKIRNNNAWETV